MRVLDWNVGGGDKLSNMAKLKDKKMISYPVKFQLAVDLELNISRHTHTHAHFGSVIDGL